MTDTMKIDGHSIYNYFMCGAQKIIYNERDLNKINVFPVADGDTGTNLALTMKMVLTNAMKDKDVSKTLASISEVATENAYGNSGMIFAQYLNGFAQETKAKQHISIKRIYTNCRQSLPIRLQRCRLSQRRHYIKRYERLGTRDEGHDRYAKLSSTCWIYPSKK